MIRSAIILVAALISCTNLTVCFGQTDNRTAGRVEQYVKQLVEKYDANGDARLEKSEYTMMRRPPKLTADQNGDGVFTIAELFQYYSGGMANQEEVSPSESVTPGLLRANVQLYRFSPTDDQPAPPSVDHPQPLLEQLKKQARIISVDTVLLEGQKSHLQIGSKVPEVVGESRDVRGTIRNVQMRDVGSLLILQPARLKDQWTLNVKIEHSGYGKRVNDNGGRQLDIFQADQIVPLFPDKPTIICLKQEDQAWYLIVHASPL